jgi:predicted transcriptional regulator
MSSESPALSPLRLDADLEARLSEAAEQLGVSPASLCEQWLLESLFRHEAALQAQSAGRCSLRTGSHSSGPRPLPLQQ